MTGKLVGQLFVTGSIAAALGLAPAAALAQTTGGPFTTGQFSCLTTAAPACPVDQSQDNSHNATALGVGIQTSAATGGAGSINISAPTQSVNAQAATDSFNGSDHVVAVGGHHFVAGGNGGSFVAIPVGGASNTGGGAPAG